MSLESKRPAPILTLLNAEDEKEPLTQSPMTAETPVVFQEEEANPIVEDAAADANEEFYAHLCEGCGMIFDCVGDANGNHAPELCVCEQTVARNPILHLVYYCSYECERETNEEV